MSASPAPAITPCSTVDVPAGLSLAGLLLPEAVADFATWLSARDIMLRVARLKDAVRELLQRAALPELSSMTLNFWSAENAANASTQPPSTRGSAK